MYPYNIESEAATQEEQYQAQNIHENYGRKISDMLTHSHKYERSNLKYYSELEMSAKNLADKKIIKEIKLDCEKHCQILADLCVKLSINPSQADPEEKCVTEKYANELSKHMFSLMDDVEFYRHLMFAEKKIKDKIHEILIDKQNHIYKLLFLQIKYSSEI